MATQSQCVEALIKKIQSLPTSRVAEIEDFVDFLQQRTRGQGAYTRQKTSLNFPVISAGKWPEDLSLHREDMYGEDGR